MRHCRIISIIASALIAPAAFTQTTGPFPVTIEVDTGKPLGELTPVWRFFGYDEANYTYMNDGRKLLSELGKLGGPQVFRNRGVYFTIFHGCLHLVTLETCVP